MLLSTVSLKLLILEDSELLTQDLIKHKAVITMRQTRLKMLSLVVLFIRLT